MGKLRVLGGCKSIFALVEHHINCVRRQGRYRAEPPHVRVSGVLNGVEFSQDMLGLTKQCNACGLKVPQKLSVQHTLALGSGLAPSPTV